MATVYREPNQVKWIGVRPGHNGEQVIVDINSAVNADLYTVPVDSLLMIFGWSWSVNQNAGADVRIEVKTDGAAHYMWLSMVTAQAGAPSSESTQDKFVPIELPEGYVISIVTTRQAYGHIHGILIDA